MLSPHSSLLEPPFTMDRYDPWPTGQWLQLKDLRHHTLVLFHPSSQVSFEVQVNNQFHHLEIDNHGHLSLIDPGVTYQIRGDQPFRVSLLHFSTNLMQTIAASIGLGNLPFAPLLRMDFGLSTVPLSDSREIAQLSPPRPQAQEASQVAYPVLASSGQWCPQPSGQSDHLEPLLNLTVKDLTLYHLATAVEIEVKADRSRSSGYLDSLILALATYLVQRYGVGRAPATPLLQSSLATHLEWQQLLHQVQQFYPSSGLAASQAPPLPVSTPVGTVTTAIAWINQLCIEQAYHPLSDTETWLLVGVLRGEGYGQIAKACNRSLGHMKSVGANLWRQLSELTGQPIRKSNLRSYLERQGLRIPPRQSSVRVTKAQRSVNPAIDD